jgi:branched-chain amino acid transport system permease protein
MSELLQQILNGLTLGAIYALIALGYTMIYGVLRFINFAHGDVFMIGAYIGYLLAPWIGSILGEGYLSAVAVLLAAMLGCGILGVIIEYLAYRPLRFRPKLTVLITAIGVSLFIENTAQLQFVFGAQYRSYPTLVPNAEVFSVMGVSVDRTAIVLLTTAVGLMYLLRLIVLKTKVGTAMRAVSMNISAAALMGININRIISFTFFVGSALAGAGATLYAISYPKIDPLMGILPGLKAFVAAVLGGIGNIAGATLGGFIIGIAETLTAGYVSPNFRDAIVFGVLILILILKPAGILGKGGTEKV